MRFAGEERALYAVVRRRGCGVSIRGRSGSGYCSLHIPKCNSGRIAHLGAPSPTTQCQQMTGQNGNAFSIRTRCMCTLRPRDDAFRWMGKGPEDLTNAAGP